MFPQYANSIDYKQNRSKTHNMNNLNKTCTESC